ncbi:MAG: hypothetical protein RLZZ546_3381 [Bacteroidota bacterium]|jgi:hypothetical protein
MVYFMKSNRADQNVLDFTEKYFQKITIKESYLITAKKRGCLLEAAPVFNWCFVLW